MNRIAPINAIIVPVHIGIHCIAVKTTTLKTAAIIQAAPDLVAIATHKDPIPENIQDNNKAVMTLVIFQAEATLVIQASQIKIQSSLIISQYLKHLRISDKE